MYKQSANVAACPPNVVLLYSSKDVDGAVSQYYDIPSLSFRTSTYRLAMFNKEPGFRFKDLMISDMVHPSAKGHRVMGELAIWLVQQTAVDLLSRPYNKADEMQAAESLPPPMMLGGLVTDTYSLVHYHTSR